MARRKLQLAYITNDAARKATYRKRKKGLLKKASELSTLCGVNVCSIIYSPTESEPVIWPSPAKVHRVIDEFASLSETDQSKKMMNQDDFLTQQIEKSTLKLRKQLKENREKEMMNIMSECLANDRLDKLSIMDLNDLGWLIDNKFMKIVAMLDSLKENDGENNGASASTSLSPPSSSAPVELGTINMNEV